jgi:hypothetical protein
MTTQEIIQKASSKGMDAVKFDKWLDKNNISNEWLDVCLTNFNDGYYNILLEDDTNILFVDGEYQDN